MNEKELQQKLDKIAEGRKLFDSIVYTDFETGEGKLNKKQTEIVKSLLEVFDDLRWTLLFNNYKKLKSGKSRGPIDYKNSGIPVKVAPCAEEYKGKTFFGILIGDAALSVSHEINSEGVMTWKHAHYNPAIFVPELKAIIYGCESFWGPIETKEDLDKVITEESIGNIWYIKLLKEMAGEMSAKEKSDGD